MSQIPEVKKEIFIFISFLWYRNLAPLRCRDRKAGKEERLKTVESKGFLASGGKGSGDKNSVTIKSEMEEEL